MARKIEQTKIEKTTGILVDDCSPSRNGYKSPNDNRHDDETPLNLKTYLAIAAITSQYISYGLAILMTSTIVSYVNADLGPDPDFTWITVSWGLCASIVVTIAGRLSDLFGRRYFLITGALVGAIGAVVGATGQSIDQMIASGVLLGVAGGLQEGCYGALLELVPNKYRIFVLGCFEASALVAFASPIIAYAMLSQTAPGWRSVYWFLFSFECFGLVLLTLFYFPPKFSTKHRRDGKTRLQLLKQFDYVGVFLFAAGCTLFLVGVNWGGRRYAWSSAHVVATMVIGLVLLAVLGFWEAYSGVPYPVLPPKLFRNYRQFTMLLIVTFVGGMLFYSMNILWPRMSALFFVPPNKPIIAGVYANMISFGTFLSGIITALFCQRVGHERWQLVGFTTIQTALIGSLASVGTNDKAQAIATVIILGAVITAPQLLVFVMMSLGIDDQVDIGVADALPSTFRLLGGSVATAIYSAILTNRFEDELPKKMMPVLVEYNIPAGNAKSLIQAAAIGTAAAFGKVPGITPEIIQASIEAVKQAYVQAFRLVYLVAIAFGVLAICCAFCTKSIPKEKKTLSRAVKLENEGASVKDDA